MPQHQVGHPSSSDKNSQPPPRQHPPSSLAQPPLRGVTSPTAISQFGFTVMGVQNSRRGGIVNDVSDNDHARATYSQFRVQVGQFGVQVGPQECENTIENIVKKNTVVRLESNGNNNKNAKNKK